MFYWYSKKNNSKKIISKAIRSFSKTI